MSAGKRELPTNEGRTFRRSCWLRVGSITKYVIVRSQAGWFEGHWINNGARSARCAGERCTICATGKEPEIFWYLFVQQDNGEVVVWNVPRRHEQLIRYLDEQANNGVGSILALHRTGIRSNSPIDVDVVGFEQAEELDIWPFVETLGNGVDLAQLRENPLRDRTRSVPSFT
jgi:hypothetical protein